MSHQYPHPPNQQPQGPYQGQTPQGQDPYQGQPPYQGQAPYQGQPPYAGAPGGYPGAPVPPQRKSWNRRHTALAVIGGLFGVFFVLVVIIGIVAGGDTDPGSTASDTVATSPSDAADAKPGEEEAGAEPAVPAKEAAEEPAPKPAPEKKELTQADEFKAFIAKNGTPAEKAAAEHIVKVQGADSDNGILDAADVYTDYAGGLMGPHQGDGKLLASAFADWKDSENGLVTIYDKDGELLSNGNY
ncbi:hypothetical protein [Streptomyces sp. NPDC002913]